MKINPSAGFEQYQKYVKSLKNGEASAPAAGKPGAPNSAKTDKVDISGQAAARAQLSGFAAALAKEVEAHGAERLTALRAQVQSGEYKVAAEDLADAILGWQGKA